jgi:predicted HTH transcriptional regulator
MDLEKIRLLISNSETDDVEYKSSVAELDKLGSAICGQLNAKGGYGFIGITDSGKIIGAEVS